MDKTTGAIVAAFVCEGLAGATLGIIFRQHIFPKCGKVDSVIVLAGGLLGSWYLGRKVNKEVCEYCDEVFDTDACKSIGWK